MPKGVGYRTRKRKKTSKAALHSRGKRKPGIKRSGRMTRPSNPQQGKPGNTPSRKRVINIGRLGPLRNGFVKARRPRKRRRRK